MKYASFPLNKKEAEVSRFAAQDDSRPTLACLRFNIDKQRVEAADGFRMIFMELRDASGSEDVAFLVNAKKFMRAVKAMKSPDFTVSYTHDGKKESAMLTDDQGVKAIVDVEEGVFPDIEQIAREQEFSPAAVLSAEYVRDALALGQSKDWSAVEFSLSGDSSSTSVTRFAGKVNAETPFQAYIMPMVTNTYSREEA